MRNDTATWQWVSDWAPAVVTHPTWYAVGNKPYRYQLIGQVEPHPGYPTACYLRLVVEYVPRGDDPLRAPEIRLITYTPQSFKKIKSTLKKATEIIYP